VQPIWRVELLGTFKANRDQESISRFRTRRVASLLAYLASFRQRLHPRDEIAEMLWPDLDLAVSRRNLRQALSSLRLVLEPPPVPKGSVIVSILDGIQLNSETVSTDVAEFESLVGLSRRSEDSARAIDRLTQAVQVYKGGFLPGFNEEWIWSERMRLEDLYLAALTRLSGYMDADEAISHLREGLVREPFEEKWHVALMRRYLELGRPSKALEQFAALESALSDVGDGPPSQESREIVRQAKRQSIGEKVVEFPPDLSRALPTQNERKQILPTYADRFFGRADEIQKISAVLEDPHNRLLTILGPAGVGKTRLSVQCSITLAESHDWNFVFVPLAERLDPSELFEAIRAAIDPKRGASANVLERIAELTDGRKTLLILDNLEHIAEEVGPELAQLLVELPDIVCLGSSRQPLQIQNERILRIDPLPIPSLNGSLAELAAIPSIQLFLGRCQTIRPDIQLNERNAGAISSLCAHLDGLPLAIELVAGLANSFSPSQMLTHLPMRLTEITSRRRDLPTRHKSLRAAIEWSYQSLSADLRTLFINLSVFRGGFNLESVAEICLQDSTKNRSKSGFDALQNLQERSLVRTGILEDAYGPRFSLLTAFREFAEECVSKDDLERVRERHAEYFARQTPPDRAFVSVEEQTFHHLAIERDHENFVAAIEFSLQAAQLERAVNILSILSHCWLTRGPRLDERRLIRLIAEHPNREDLPSAAKIRLCRMIGTTCIRSGEYAAAYESCARAVEIAKSVGDSQLVATSYSGLSVCAEYLNRLQECLELNEKVLALVGYENLVLAERAYLGIGSVRGNMGEIELAQEAFDAARSVSEKLRGGEPDALIVVNQAHVALTQNRLDDCFRFVHEAIRISKRLADEFTLAVALSLLSRYQSRQLNFEAAAITNLEALEKFRQGDFVYWVLQSLRDQALIWIDLGRFQDSATLLAATIDSATSEKTQNQEEVRRGLERIRMAISPKRYESAWARGLILDRRDAIRLAKS
jgi:predicted ATPase/DNA-binding SARP family transcriptional activator